MIAYIGLGSNRGDRERHLARALQAMGRAGIRVVGATRSRATAPVGATGRRGFLNCVAEVETELLPRVLLRRLRQIERAEGRHHTPARGGSREPRSLDLDLLFYGRARIATPELEVPHPRALQRRFIREALPARLRATG